VSDYDVVVIGSGPAGYPAAIRSAQNGLEVAIVEREPTERLGGTCLLRGCIPTKAMLETASLYDKMSHSEDFGITTDNPEIDMEKVEAYREKNVEKNAKGVAYLMKKNEIDVHWGRGRIAGPGEVSVGKEDGEENLETDHCVLATGSACAHLPSIETDGERILDSDELLQCSDVPDHLLVLGAGAVGVEWASCYHRYGSDVTIVELEGQIVPAEDDDVSAELRKSFERQGMEVRTGAKVTDVERTDEGVEAVVEAISGGESEVVEASHFLMAVGRRPVTEDVGLGPTAVEIDEKGFIPVDESMQTAEDWIYAVGDIVQDTPQLAHVGTHEGVLAADDIAGEDPHPIDYDTAPMCTYCSPEVASVGITEADAEERGYDVKTSQFPFSAIGKATIVGQEDGFVKVVSEEKYDELLGLHIVGPKATELITEGTVAMNLESTTLEVEHTIHPHPTLSEAVGEAAHAILGEPIHM